jgi:hypothetical protein
MARPTYQKVKPGAPPEAKIYLLGGKQLRFASGVKSYVPFIPSVPGWEE